MKCQKCGINEVSFHHSTNVNGCVTETHLCSKCAAESGYDIEKLFELGNIFDGMLLMQGGINGFLPVAISNSQANTMFPFTMRPLTGMIEQGAACDCGCGSTAKASNIEVDEEMKKRRELNALMRAAVAAEEFEKAAELRDQIRAIEAGGLQKCDSETTTTQDSPTAQ